MAKELFEKINNACVENNKRFDYTEDHARNCLTECLTMLRISKDKGAEFYRNYFSNQRLRGFSALEMLLMSKPTKNNDMPKFAPIAFASKHWLKDKIFFEFDESLEKQIQESFIADSEDVPASLLNRIPYSCFFVSTRGGFVDWEIENRFMELGSWGETTVTGNGVGFFVVISPQVKYDERVGGLVNSGNKVMDIISCAADKSENAMNTATVSMVIPREDSDITIKEAMIPYVPYDTVTDWNEEQQRLSYQYDLTILLSALQYILYLCAENNEIKQRILPKAKSWASKKKKSASTVKIFDVSEPKTRDFPPKNYYSESSDYESGTGSPKSPHVRRGHWHTYWTGKRGERTPKVIWIAETRVHPELETSGAILKAK